jgi:hypothetical protein
MGGRDEGEGGGFETWDTSEFGIHESVREGWSGAVERPLGVSGAREPREKQGVGAGGTKARGAGGR